MPECSVVPVPTTSQPGRTLPVKPRCSSSTSASVKFEITSTPCWLEDPESSLSAGMASGRLRPFVRWGRRALADAVRNRIACAPKDRRLCETKAQEQFVEHDFWRCSRNSAHDERILTRPVAIVDEFDNLARRKPQAYGYPVPKPLLCASSERDWNAFLQIYLRNGKKGPLDISDARPRRPKRKDLDHLHAGSLAWSVPLRSREADFRKCRNGPSSGGRCQRLLAGRQLEAVPGSAASGNENP